MSSFPLIILTQSLCRDDIVKELAYKGFFGEDEELSSPQSRDRGDANIEGNGSVLHEESIKDILEEGTAMYKQRWNLSMPSVPAAV